MKRIALFAVLGFCMTIPSFVMVIFLVLAVVGNINSLPQNNRDIHNDFYKNTALLIKSLRHLDDLTGEHYRVPNVIKEDPVYMFFKSRIRGNPATR